MDSFRFYSKNQRQQNFELAHDHLNRIFSKYPYPGELQGCSCCTGNHLIKTSDDKDLDFYLSNAIWLLGTEENFKFYLPTLLKFVYIDKKGDSSYLINKFPSVNFLEEEAEALANWFIAYLQFKYIDDFEMNVQESRVKAQNWLNDPVSLENIYFDLPFSIFLEIEYNEELKFLLHSSVLEDFSNLLDLWPENELDLIVFAFYLTNYYLNFADQCKQIFQLDKVWTWILDVEKRLEDYFWATSNSQLQQLLSDALSIMINVKKCFKAT